MTDSTLSKGPAQVALEYIALAACLAVIALRITFTEAPGGQASDQPINLGDQLYSLSISTVLILSVLLWFVCRFCSKRFSYRFSAIGFGLLLFVIATIVATLAAANKRAAITSSATLLAPALMAVLLVQILDSQAKIKLVLVVIAALGVVSAHQSAEQAFGGNEAMIQQYKQAPETFLEPLGIESGTFAHMLFEHRLYSRGVRGFFTNSNSAGSFGLMASFAAIALFIDALANRKSPASGSGRLVTVTIAAAVVIFGLVITASKGATAASLVAAVMFVVYLLLGDWLKRHKAAILIVCLLLALICGCIVVAYGVIHGQLPGGNSMLVRWQYWQAAARMYRDYPLIGVGGGNFTHVYPQYKPAPALETVADPHCFPLSVLTQYGPLGLAGFLAMILLPLWTIIAPASKSVTSPTERTRLPSRALALTFLVFISTILLFVRPSLLKIPSGTSSAERMAASLILYVMPTIAFAAGFLVLTLGRITPNDQGTKSIKAALFCAIVGVLVHNLIDFAIFEPPVLTTFWAITACLVALDLSQRPSRQYVISPRAVVRILIVAAFLLSLGAYLAYALLPVAKATASIKQALAEREFPHQLLERAAEDDPLDPTALSLDAKLYLHQYKEQFVKQLALLQHAAECLLTAIDRNPVDFKNRERLSEVYNLLARSSTGQTKTEYLNKALDSALAAVELYPGCGRLRISLAQIAEQLNKPHLALQHYQKAVDIEKAYRDQFKIMYPGREVFSRLGKEEYNHAKQRIEELSGKPTP
ncbi:MAG: O-antigen ligase family protein [Planctomycetota bacterium]